MPDKEVVLLAEAYERFQVGTARMNMWCYVGSDCHTTTSGRSYAPMPADLSHRGERPASRSFTAGRLLVRLSHG